MARSRQFDTTAALRAAARAFWRHGYAGTGLEALLSEMQIGRQSLYNSFGDKRQLYLEALRLYSKESVEVHVSRLEAPEAPLDGLRDLLRGLAVEDDDERAKGCFGVASATEFGTSDPAVTAATTAASEHLRKRVLRRVEEAQTSGSLPTGSDARAVTTLILQQMTAIQVAARSGASAGDMRASADFVIDDLLRA